MLAAGDLDVLVLTHNRRLEVRRCLDSLVPQWDDAARVVVVDNASSDGTPAMVCESFPRAVVVESAANLGCAGGRNFGIAQCSAPWVVCVDDDATAPPGFLAACRAAVDRWPDAAILGGTYRDAFHAPPEQLTEGPAMAFIGGVTIYHRSTFLAVGGFPEETLNYGEERVFRYRLRQRSERGIVRVPSVWLHHHVADTPQRWAGRFRLIATQDMVAAVRYAPLLTVPVVLAVRTVANLKKGAQRGHLGSIVRGLATGYRLAFAPSRPPREPVPLRVYFEDRLGLPQRSTPAR